jgi:hypothetical protein
MLPIKAQTSLFEAGKARHEHEVSVLEELTSSPPRMEEIPTVSEIEGVPAHLGGVLLHRGCPGEKA